MVELYNPCLVVEMRNPNQFSAYSKQFYYSPKFWLALLLIFQSLKLTLALFVFRQPANAFVPDSYGYEDLALNLLQRGRFDVPDEPMIGWVRTPGYPVFVAIIYATIGRIPGGVVLLQLILDALTAWLIWQIGRDSFSKPIGIVGAFIYALSPNATIGALYLLSDTLFTFLLIGALYVLHRYWIVRDERMLFLLGLVLGLLPLVRPIGLYLVLIWIIFFTLKQWRDSVARWYRHTFAASVFIVIFVGLWIARNYALTGYTFFSTAEGFNLYCCFAPAALAEDEHISVPEAYARLNASFRFQSLNKVSVPELFRAAEYATQIILQHPIGYAKVHLKGVFATLFEPAYKQWLQIVGVEYTASGFVAKIMARDFSGAINALSQMTHTGRFWLMLPILNIIYTIVVYVFAIWGAYKIFRFPAQNDQRALILLCVVTILYLVFVPGSGGGLRFRIPAEPLFALLAAIGGNFWVVSQRKQAMQER
jgi:4-amino-4-deoxy-L-arabinose transferase-like glycosyltransferase